MLHSQHTTNEHPKSQFTVTLLISLLFRISQVSFTQEPELPQCLPAPGTGLLFPALHSSLTLTVLSWSPPGLTSVLSYSLMFLLSSPPDPLILNRWATPLTSTVHRDSVIKEVFSQSLKKKIDIQQNSLPRSLSFSALPVLKSETIRSGLAHLYCHQNPRLQQPVSVSFRPPKNAFDKCIVHKANLKQALQ